MTYEEALEFAKGGLEIYEKDYSELTEQIEFQKLVIKAMEKQIPQKLNGSQGYNLKIHNRCPSCDYDLYYFCEADVDWVDWVDKEYMPKYCPECGKALDWSED